MSAKMTLSEAIRLGAMLGPQARGSLTTLRRKYIFFGPMVNEYCAMGAAFAAVGARTIERQYQSDGVSSGFRGGQTTYKAGDTYRAIEHPWHTLTWERHGCPRCPGEIMEIYRLIPHLNDHHKWTRERIADFVETLEQQAQKTVKPTFAEEDA